MWSEPDPDLTPMQNLKMLDTIAVYRAHLFVRNVEERSVDMAADCFRTGYLCAFIDLRTLSSEGE